MKRSLLPALALLGFAVASANAANIDNVYITEWMYKPAASATPNLNGFGEFVEITNVGSTPVSMAGWSLDDSHAVPGAFDISSIGTLAAGESAVITDDTADNFRAVWNLPATVPVVGGHDTDNFGNGDQINIFDASNNIVDSLTYGTSPATFGFSGNIPLADLGTDDPTDDAVLSSVGDAFGSVMSSEGNVGNPGFYLPANSTTPAPEPASLSLLALGAAGLLARRK